MTSIPLYISHKKFDIPFPVLSRQSLGLKGSNLNKKISKVIENRKNFYSSLCTSRAISPNKRSISLEHIKSSMSKAKIIKLNPTHPCVKSTKSKKISDSHINQPSILEIKAKNGILLPNRIGKRKRF